MELVEVLQHFLQSLQQEEEGAQEQVQIQHLQADQEQELKVCLLELEEAEILPQQVLHKVIMEEVVKEEEVQKDQEVVEELAQ
jgi:hypothetical protein